ncbi:MdtA/MuxA family multidrug efflux RND transporter periplasmic adaptor subunit [Corallococcus terminator]|uniref:MdtA/MuxA family multidrug efflux RND transporter periplasmic adaptor subunit n=1 Tax=Corallococcus terminator TaxID=2316733 RepID=A0A3A8J8V4_9BACT|nr:MdtA/MuxA family multidrug efflux RND transporter periplasmic adaptor subunit [Corallococcus terminator]RKG86911.1 MdtA/MuxA family multidrug efflux RND transporter periplasmic adaptor subunit [Corallococcus terminator]
MSTPPPSGPDPAAEASLSPSDDDTSAQAPAEGAPHHRRLRWGWLLLLAGLVLVAVVFMRRHPPATSATTAAGGADGGHGGARGPQPVVTAQATTRDVPVFIVGLGAVTPTASVAVHSRVDGQLMRVTFQEGQHVNEGDLLAEIDPRPYLSQLEQVRGQLARDEAVLENARLDLRRYTALLEQDSVARQTLDTQRALVRQYQGIVKADRGAVAAAELNLAYTRITAPVSGRVGLRLVDPGNIIHAADATGLVVVNTLQPITMIFSIPEDRVPQVMAKLEAREVLAVDAFDRARQQLLATGTLLTVDNQIDPNTGTVRLKATFPNRDSRLFPQQFVNARLRIDTLPGATVVPTAALQHGVQGTFVYVVQPDNTAHLRPVTTGPTDGDDTVITQGVHPGDAVVVEGADKLTQGAPVRRQRALSSGPGVGGSGGADGGTRAPDGGR